MCIYTSCQGGPGSRIVATSSVQKSSVAVVVVAKTRVCCATWHTSTILGCERSAQHRAVRRCHQYSATPFGPSSISKCREPPPLRPSSPVTSENGSSQPSRGASSPAWYTADKIQLPTSGHATATPERASGDSRSHVKALRGATNAAKFCSLQGG